MLKNRLPDRLGGLVSPYEMYFVRPFLGFDSEENIRLWGSEMDHAGTGNVSTAGRATQQERMRAFLGRVKHFYEEVLPYVNAEGEVSASRMKISHDRKNKNNMVDFKQNDLVWVLRDPDQRTSKAEDKYFGPCRIVHVSKSNGFTLQDSTGGVLGRTYVANQLKRAQEVENVQQAIEARDAEQRGELIEGTHQYESIVGHRRDNQGKYEFKIRWMGFGPEEDTWEPEANIVDKHWIRVYFQNKGASNEMQGISSASRRGSSAAWCTRSGTRCVQERFQ
jgi:hypothetical protein